MNQSNIAYLKDTRPTTPASRGSRRTSAVLLLFVIVLFLPSLLFSQSSEERFIKLLISNSDSVINCVDKTELIRANRLGISYTGVKNKWLIGFDIDEQLKSDIKEGRMQYDVSVKQLEDGFSVADFSVPQIKYSKSFYFKNGKFAPNSAYFTRSWVTKESKYFILKISEPKYFNNYCIRKLDEFVDKMADTLEFTNEARTLLKEQKLYYMYCKDENEVEQLTGYKSKGQAILAYDEVITAFQTHYHELVHLLINYKLKNLGLYTLPFFMEGFAVAMGGRGGMAPRVVTDLGYYLQKTGFLTYDSILTYDAFMSQDANMTYSVSSLYNTFLFSELGAKKYLELYKSVNGDLESVKRIDTKRFYFSSDLMYQNFLEKYDKQNPVKFEYKGYLEYHSIFSSIILYLYKLIEHNSLYYFNTGLDRPLAFGNNSKNEVMNYESRKYEEAMKMDYAGLKYMFMVDSNSIKFYDCFNDELIVSYDRNFSLDHMMVPHFVNKNGNNYLFPFFYFSVDSRVFNKEIPDDEQVEINK